MIHRQYLKRIGILFGAIFIIVGICFSDESLLLISHHDSKFKSFLEDFRIQDEKIMIQFKRASARKDVEEMYSQSLELVKNINDYKQKLSRLSFPPLFDKLYSLTMEYFDVYKDYINVTLERKSYEQRDILYNQVASYLKKIAFESMRISEHIMEKEDEPRQEQPQKETSTFAVSERTEDSAQPNLEVTGIIKDEEPIAIVNGKVVKEGDNIEGVEIIEIKGDCVRYKYKGTLYEEKLKTLNLKPSKGGKDIKKVKSPKPVIIHKKTQNKNHTNDNDVYKWAEDLSAIDQYEHSVEEFVSTLNIIHNNHPSYSFERISDLLSYFWWQAYQESPALSFYEFANGIMIESKETDMDLTEIMARYMLLKKRGY